MKKHIVLLLVSALCFSIISACGTKENPGNTENSQVSETNTQEPESDNNSSEADNYYETGRANLYGLGDVEINLEKALDAFTKAKELGKTEANFYLGVLCDWYKYPTEDFVKAREYYEAAGENPYAYIALGFLYDGGQGVTEDDEKAQSYWTKARDAGCMDVKCVDMFTAYTTGDYETARQLCLEVIEKGTEPLYTSQVWNQLGTIYRLGRGVEIDYVKAVECYTRAVEEAWPAAMSNLSWHYLNGKGVEKDYTKGLELLKQSKALGRDVAPSRIENIEECIAVAEKIEDPVYLSLTLYFYNENEDREFSADDVYFNITKDGAWMQLGGFREGITFDRYMTMSASGEGYLEITLFHGEREKTLIVPNLRYDNEKKPSELKVSITWYGIDSVEWK